ncbi:uncharacterized protein LOC112346501 [Selaginella moellendorffii]|uniref:uncharacterized protein LOC112346501 n=1 Tax=Selaginella moellendorffii TaxID=88036 RepID=UPI000D1C4117|nr:uncharacterized protein LOC112346501 [Selaginella moellendorffii]|eukprot:XP_024531339.1 uncharacterized protein LOC112346501 [Selaginella moellendorffii]
MEEMEMECEGYTVCYCVTKARERLDPTISALKRHSSATADDVAVGTPLGDVVTGIKQDKGVSHVYLLHTSESRWIEVTDSHLALSFSKGAFVYLKFVKDHAAGKHSAVR